MEKKVLTTEDVVSMACQILPRVFYDLKGRELSGKVMSFRYNLEEKINKALRDKPETRTCSKCNEEKIIEEFYCRNNREPNAYRDPVCRRCRIAKAQKEYQARVKCITSMHPDLEQSFGGKTNVDYLEEEERQLTRLYKERSRAASIERYYKEGSVYLLKKYLNRHKGQLERCLCRKSNAEEELKSDNDKNKTWKLKAIIIRMEAKSRRLKEFIEQEQELINNPEKRKEPTHE